MATEMAHNLGKLTDQGGDKVSQQFHELMADGRKVTATDYLAAVAEGRAMGSLVRWRAFSVTESVDYSVV